MQLGTPFAVTVKGAASDTFKRVLAEATDEDLVEFTSVAGLPARAVATPWLKAYLLAEPRLQAIVRVKARCTKAFDCLAQCGLRDGLPGWGQFCIDHQLAAARRGDLKRGLYFRGAGALPCWHADSQRARVDRAPAEPRSGLAAGDRAGHRSRGPAGLSCPPTLAANRRGTGRLGAAPPALVQSRPEDCGAG